MMILNWKAGAFALTVALISTAYAQEPKQPKAKAQTAEPQKETQTKDPKVDSLLKEMSDYMRTLPSFGFDANFTTEAVMADGEKLNYNGQSRVLVDRRYGIRSDRRDPELDVSLYYDKDKITVYKRGSHFYASADAPADMDAAIDFARDQLNLEAPGADLLYSNPYEVLTDGVISSRYLGVEDVNGVPAHHLALRGPETDIQLWVQTGGTPLPLRYIITTKDVRGFPQFIVDLANWDVAPRVSEEMFAFVPPPGAQQIAFRNQPEGPQKSAKKGS